MSRCPAGDRLPFVWQLDAVRGCLLTAALGSDVQRRWWARRIIDRYHRMFGVDLF